MKTSAVLPIGFVVFSLAFVTGCFYGPKAERKSQLSYLNGENYNTTPTGGANAVVLPIIERKERLTKLSGSVLLREGIADIPLKNVRVELLTQGGMLLHGATTGIDGKFVLNGAIQNGGYVLKLASKTYDGQVPIEVRKYELAGVIIHAGKKPKVP